MKNKERRLLIKLLNKIGIFEYYLMEKRRSIEYLLLSQREYDEDKKNCYWDYHCKHKGAVNFLDILFSTIAFQDLKDKDKEVRNNTKNNKED